ncbi:hypothetical protein EJ02DRAFT_456333 [Clathrospora elynae]|uniref:DUF7730 domain-containing protein n=1 Tax=Clathrospora elynae TaxID=706981 RepID=A0A6A5SHD9_9PLEO|nr:hypothetical protein EJ02DRAFT_456333 [Clathrospora elynae]
MSDISQSRRVRRLQSRKRSVSVDGSRWKKKRETKEQGQSAFFARLPPEIRLRVYEMVLCEQEDVYVHPNYEERRDFLNVRAWRGCSPQLLRTCRRIYREAIPTLYSENSFTFACPTTFFAFTSSIPPPRLPQLKHLTITTLLHHWSSDHYGASYNTSDYGALYNTSDYGALYNPSDYEKLFELLTETPGNRTFCLRYSIRDREYSSEPLMRDFGLLESFEAGPRVEGCLVFHEIRTGWGKDEGEDTGGGEAEKLMFGRWRVNERIRLSG